MNNENEVMEKAPVLTKKDCVKGHDKRMSK